MDKLRFDFKMRGASDGKTTILCLTSIGTPDNRTFLIPDEFQNVVLHKELVKTKVFDKVKIH